MDVQDAMDSMVVAGPRKDKYLPQIFVEEVDETKSSWRNKISPTRYQTSANLRKRTSPTNSRPSSNLTSTPHQKMDYDEAHEATFDDSGYQGHTDSFSEAGWNGLNGKEKNLWDTFGSPSKDLWSRSGWKGRASFVEDEQSMPWLRKLGPQQILKCLVLAVIMASFGFAVLTYTRHMSGRQVNTTNDKYKSIKFGVEKRSLKMEEERKRMEDVKDVLDENDIKLDEDGNLMHLDDIVDIDAKEEVVEEGNLDSLLELEAQLTEIRNMLSEAEGENYVEKE